MKPNPIALELRAMADRLRELFPESEHIELAAKRYRSLGIPNDQSISFHRAGTYQNASALMSRIGIGDRRKSIHDENSANPWSALQGQADGVDFTAFATTLPPSCRIETKTVRIPKTAVVDTGDFVEIEERVVRCGPTEAVS